MILEKKKYLIFDWSGYFKVPGGKKKYSFGIVPATLEEHFFFK